MTVVLETRVADQALRRHHADQRRVDQRGEGRAPGADRPERRRQDDADQPADRRGRADRGHDLARRARTSPGSRRTSACGAASCAPSRSTSCSASSRRCSRSALAVSAHLGIGARWWRPLGSDARVVAGLRKAAGAVPPRRRDGPAGQAARLRQAAAARDRHRARLRAARAAARRAGGRRARRRAPGDLRHRQRAAGRRDGAADRARHGPGLQLRRSA